MRRLARSLEIAGWLLLATIPVTLFAPGCQGRECESDGFKDYGFGPGEGHLVDTTTWESSPNDGTWIGYGPYHTWIFHPVELDGRSIVSVLAYVSADPRPSAPGNNFTLASGNLAEITVADPNDVFITNATCSPLYIRVVITAGPAEPSPTDDGGTIPDASDSGASDLDAGDGGD